MLTKESQKYMTLFNKDSLTNDIVETVISHLRLEEYHYSQPFKEFLGDQKTTVESSINVSTFFNNEAITIEEGIHRMLGEKVNPEPEIVLDWVQIDNKVPYTANNAFIKTLKKNNSHLAEKSLLMQKCEKKMLYGILIKEHQGSSMSKVKSTNQEFSDFLSLYFEILNEQVKKIDEGKYRLGFNKFLNCKASLTNSAERDRDKSEHTVRHAVHHQKHRGKLRSHHLQWSLQEKSIRDGH